MVNEGAQGEVKKYICLWMLEQNRHSGVQRAFIGFKVGGSCHGNQFHRSAPETTLHGLNKLE